MSEGPSRFREYIKRRAGESNGNHQKRLKRLEKGLCPECGSVEWAFGMACWHCGFDSARWEDPEAGLR